MEFTTSLSPETVQRLRQQFAKGMDVWRGIRRPGSRPADPGDFGIGEYHSTSYSRASGYGNPVQRTVTLANPLILTVNEAYDQIADRFGTISGVAGRPQGGAGDFEERAKRAQEAAQGVIAAGFDGLAAINERSNEIEIVVFAKDPTAAHQQW